MATTMPTTMRATEADLWNAPDDGGRYELVDGAVVRMSPAGQRHGRVNIELATRLRMHLGASNAGLVLDSSTGSTPRTCCRGFASAWRTCSS
jgi:Uma2 family endonuclease